MLFLLVGVENRQTFLFFRTIWGRATCVTSDSSMSWTFRPPFIVCQEKSLFYFIQCCTKSLNIHVKTKFTNSTVDILISSIAIAINKVNTNLFSQSFCIRILRETGVLQGGLWSVLSASTRGSFLSESESEPLAESRPKSAEPGWCPAVPLELCLPARPAPALQLRCVEQLGSQSDKLNWGELGPNCYKSRVKYSMHVTDWPKNGKNTSRFANFSKNLVTVQWQLIFSLGR